MAKKSRAEIRENYGSPRSARTGRLEKFPAVLEKAERDR